MKVHKHPSKGFKINSLLVSSIYVSNTRSLLIYVKIASDWSIFGQSNFTLLYCRKRQLLHKINCKSSDLFTTHAIKRERGTPERLDAKISLQARKSPRDWWKKLFIHILFLKFWG